MGQSVRVVMALVALLGAGEASSQSPTLDLVYTSDLRGTVGICG